MTLPRESQSSTRGTCGDGWSSVCVCASFAGPVLIFPRSIAHCHNHRGTVPFERVSYLRYRGSRPRAHIPPQRSKIFAVTFRRTAPTSRLGPSCHPPGITRRICTVTSRPKFRTQGSAKPLWLVGVSSGCCLHACSTLRQFANCARTVCCRPRSSGFLVLICAVSRVRIWFIVLPRSWPQ